MLWIEVLLCGRSVSETCIGYWNLLALMATFDQILTMKVNELRLFLVENLKSPSAASHNGYPQFMKVFLKESRMTVASNFKSTPSTSATSLLLFLLLGGAFHLLQLLKKKLHCIKHKKHGP